MHTVAEKRDALITVAFAALGFCMLVATTSSNQYGMLLMPSHRLLWSITRIVPVLLWLSVAGLIVLFRDELSWEGAAASFMASLVLGSAAIVWMGPAGIDPTSVMASVTYYSVISALLCLTVRSVIFCIALGPVFLVAQVVLDVLAQLASGVLQLAI